METDETIAAADVPALVARYQEPLLRFARRSVPQDAEDVVQEGWFRLVRALKAGTLIHREQVHFWLYRALTNLLIDRARRESRLHFFPLFVDEPGSDDLEERVVQRVAVEAVLARLRPTYAEVLCRDALGESGREMASALHLNEGTVRVRLQRGRAAFAVLWNGQEVA